MRQQIVQQIKKALEQRNGFFIREEDIQLYLANYLINTKLFDRVYIEYHIPSDLIGKYPWKDKKNIYVDIVVKYEDHFYPIEIKYKTVTQEVPDSFVFGEKAKTVLLGQHGAQNIGCYDFWKDVKRVELFDETFSKCERGIVLFVSNDETYRKEPLNSVAGYANFSIHEGRSIPANSTLDWNKRDGEDLAVAKVRPPLTITYEYVINWTPMQIDKHYYILV